MLICEDDPDIAKILVEILRQEGMRAEAVPDARAARAALSGVRFDVALIDLHLPDADGLDFIAELRTQAATKALPVIVVTARSRNASDADRSARCSWRIGCRSRSTRNVCSIRSGPHSRGPRDRRARILHVEDDESITRLVDELLAEEADVVAAYTLHDARQHVRDGGYDLVILDITLGDGSGLDLLPLLGEGGRTAPPVILYSATEPSRELTHRVQGALVKSRDSVDQLLATVRSLANGNR